MRLGHQHKRLGRLVQGQMVEKLHLPLEHQLPKQPRVLQHQMVKVWLSKVVQPQVLQLPVLEPAAASHKSVHPSLQGLQLLGLQVPLWVARLLLVVRL
jgi:hypothetical protein